LSDAAIDTSEFYTPAGQSSPPHQQAPGGYDTSALHNPAPLNNNVLVTQAPAADPAPTGSANVVVRGGGDVGVATDEMLAKAENLHAICEQSAPLATVLHEVAAGLEPQNYSSTSVVAMALEDAEASLTIARTQLRQAARAAGEIADAMDAAALSYGEAERRMQADFISSQTMLATIGVNLITLGNPLGPALILIALWFFGGQIRDAVGGAIEPKDTDVPAAANQLISSPAFVRTVRLSMMSLDDVLSALFHLPNPATGQDAAIAAGILLVAAQYAGLFDDSPVKTKKVTTKDGREPAAGFEDCAYAIPSAVDGEKAQVRIDVISEEGKPDRFQVFIGGTADFSPLAKDEPFDMTSNVEMMAGLPAGALAGVKQAMADAGITADSEVMFAGHSQGGLIAQTLVASGEYNTAALVTFGSPGGGIVINPGIPAILFENDDDIVTALGGIQMNSDAVIVTGRAFEHAGDVLADVALPAHRIEAYGDLARIADNDAASNKVAGVRDVLADFAAGDTTVTSNYYQVTRDVP